MQKFGIDVSHWQKGFNFANAIKTDKIEYAILKIGGSDGSKGLYKDSSFETFYADCKKNKLPVGAYFFGKDLTVEAAKKSAEYTIGLLKGKQFEYPIFYDVEGAMIKLNKTLLTDIIKTYCSTVEKAGYFVGIYSSQSFYNSNMNDKALAGYTHWVAKYSSTAPKLTSGNQIAMWQFGGGSNFIRSKTICGMTVDQDFCYVDYPKMIIEKKLNGFGNAIPPIESPIKPTPAPAITYYPTYKGLSLKIDDVFKTIGAPYGNVTKRTPVATKNGITQYKGTAQQNLALISLAKKGKLVK